MNLKGMVHRLLPVQQITETFKKQEVIVLVVENPQYPEYIKVEAVNERTALIQDLAPGDSVDIDFNLRGRLYRANDGSETAFNTLVLWRIKTTSAPINRQRSPVVNQVVGVPVYNAPVGNIAGNNEEGDPPF